MGGGECGFFFFSKMGVGVIEKGAGSVGPAWQWKEGRAAASRRWAPFRKGKLFTGPSEMELDWA